MQQLSDLPLLVVIKILRYQVAALVAASIIGGGPWAFNAKADTFTGRACSNHTLGSIEPRALDAAQRER
jgi:hypothetical protein